MISVRTVWRNAMSINLTATGINQCGAHRCSTRTNFQQHKPICGHALTVDNHRHAHTSSTTTSSTSTPKLSHTMRQLIKLVHPDLYASHPSQQHINSQSLQQLLSLFTEIKSPDLDTSYPTSRHIQLQFYIHHDRLPVPSTSKPNSRTDALTQLRCNAIDVAANKPISHRLLAQHQRASTKQRQQPLPIPPNIWSGWYITQPSHDFYCVGLTMSLNGGKCKTLVERSVGVLFALCGLPTRFVWDSEYFVDKQQQVRMVNEAQQDGGEESEDAEYQRLMKQQDDIDRLRNYA